MYLYVHCINENIYIYVYMYMYFYVHMKKKTKNVYLYTCIYVNKYVYIYIDTPSGKQPQNYGKSSCLMDKLAISMAMFNIFLT